MTTNNLDNRVRVYNMIHDSQPIASVKNKSHKIKCISNVGSSQTSIFGAIISNTWRGMVCAQCMFSFFAYVSREILSKFYIYVQYIDRFRWLNFDLFVGLQRESIAILPNCKAIILCWLNVEENKCCSHLNQLG